MLDHEAFFSIPNCLDVEGLKLLVIVIGRKPACWKCGETGYFSSSCPEKKTSGSQAPVDQNPPLTASLSSTMPVKGMPVSGTGVVKTPVVSSSHPSFPEKPLPAASAVVEKGN